MKARRNLVVLGGALAAIGVTYAISAWADPPSLLTFEWLTPPGTRSPLAVPPSVGYTNPVSVDLTNYIFEGSISATHKAGNGAFLRCYVYATSKSLPIPVVTNVYQPATVRGFCEAGEATGHSVMCSTTNLAHIDAIRSINYTSYVRVRYEESIGSPIVRTCVEVTVSQGTDYPY